MNHVLAEVGRSTRIAVGNSLLQWFDVRSENARIIWKKSRQK